MKEALVFWIVLLAILLIVEFLTVGLTSIWFAGGALAALVVCALGGTVWWQIFAFVVVSALLLYFTRPLALKYLQPRRIKTNYEELEGKTVRIVERVDNIAGTGKAVYNGMEWSARAKIEDCIFEAGDVATVESVSGVKLILCRKEEQKEN